MTRIDPQTFEVLCTTTEHDQNGYNFETPLPAGWSDSFIRVSGSGIICVEEPKPDCVTAESALVSARQVLKQTRKNPWRLAYAGADEKFKHRYEHVYQPFYFYDFGEEDFSRLRAHLFESLPLLDENTQSQIRKLFYPIDGILRHGRFDSSDVFFAAKVNAMASILSEIAGDVFLYQNIDPALSVPFYFPGSVCDLERFSAFWDYLDQVLKGDFNSKSPEEVVTALDAALAADLQNEKRFIDEPTKYALGAIFRRLKYELSLETLCEDSAGSLAVLDITTQALFWAYNASDVNEVALHSRFNPEPFYAKPAVTLIDVFSVKTLEEISQFSDDVDYYAIQDHAYHLYEALASLHYVVVDNSPDAERENYIQMHWNDLDSLKILAAASDRLFRRALYVNATYPEPVFGIPQVQLQTRLNEIQKRLHQRIVEVQAERAIATVPGEDG